MIIITQRIDIGICIHGDGQLTSLEKKSPARTVDSYRTTLEILIKNFDIQNCFEWGPGISTRMFLDLGCKITSVESDNDYINYIEKKYNLPTKNIVLEEDTRYYPFVNGDNVPYDLILVDGRMRNQCLRHAKFIVKENGFVILHDAERDEYAEGIANYTYIIYTDNSNTAVLTNHYDQYSKARQLLSTHSV